MKYDQSTRTFCLSCGEECGTKEVDEGIGPYEYWGMTGYHSDWVTVSDCCGESIGEGYMVCDVTTVHRARKDHLNRHGYVLVHKGKLYRKTYRRWYYYDGTENVGRVSITKHECFFQA